MSFQIFLNLPLNYFSQSEKIPTCKFNIFLHVKVSQASRENHRRGDQLAAEQTDAYQHHGGEHRGDRAGLRQHSAPGLLQGHGEHQQHVEEPGPRDREDEPGIDMF